MMAIHSLSASEDTLFSKNILVSLYVIIPQCSMALKIMVGTAILSTVKECHKQHKNYVLIILNSQSLPVYDLKTFNCAIMI